MGGFVSVAEYEVSWAAEMVRFDEVRKERWLR